MNHGAVYIGVPSHDGRLDYRQDAALQSVRRRYTTALRVNVASLLCFNFNQLWAHALNLRPEGVTHFVLLHDDVVPQESPEGEDWLTALMREADAHALDAVSVALPVKNQSGKTSTAIDVPDGEPVNVLMPDIAGSTMVSADAPGLLINTGCLLVDLRKPWVENFCFTTRDRIVFDGVTYTARVDPEDWEMSRWMRKAGVRFGSTGKVRALHVGRKSYQNWSAE